MARTSWLLRDPNWAPAMDLVEALPAERRLAVAGRAAAVPTVARDIATSCKAGYGGGKSREAVDIDYGCFVERKISVCSWEPIEFAAALRLAFYCPRQEMGIPPRQTLRGLDSRSIARHGAVP